MDVESLTINKHSWDETAHRFFGRNPLPEYGPLAPSEEELNLFGDVTNLKVLEIGCGSGHSLQYMDQKKAGELWGLDLSNKQINAAKMLLKNSNSPVKLFESPMEVTPGLPTNYFDIAFSIYTIGWTANLEKTLAHISHIYL
ncbi:class I SAM-dependent methyltransferase [Bacillus sp. BP-3]|uniref:class I SAM-dependent methyltransferase n=1 Tax=Bacillus sp. BP-3 TaxID=3022773 RepID=UPI00232E5513|nr:class I SAM-dependent methyltransferase [Bacillus sp. BP-3]MDC2863579.1 class I SAM-dependent methyltransferase [Bacillus sp. BP-3]